MKEAMVTGRMSQEKKDAGNAVLERVGMKPSQAINRLYDLLIERQDAGFLLSERQEGVPRAQWAAAEKFVDGLVVPWSVDDAFLNASNKDVALARLASKGLM